MLLGNDISHYQTVNWTTYKNNTNFVIIKATEGNGYTDTSFASFRTNARANNIPLGYYHFARPDLGNTPQQEADYFCNLIDSSGGIQVGEIVCLDYEVSYGDPVNWCKEWMDIVKAHYGGRITPFIYLNQSHTTGYNWTSVVNAGYLLWLASYTGNPNINTGNTGAWSSMTMQQWTSSQSVPGLSGGVDGDVFFGSLNLFKSYGYQATAGNASPSATPSPTPSRSISSTPSPSPTPSQSISSTPSHSPSATGSVSSTPSFSPSASIPPPPPVIRMAVSKAGKDVLTITNPNDFIFNSDYNTLKILAPLSYIPITVPANTTGVYTVLAHGLGYSPMVEGFCRVDNQSRAICTFEGAGNYPFTYFFDYISADAYNIYVRLRNNDSSSHVFNIKVFMFENAFMGYSV